DVAPLVRSARPEDDSVDRLGSRLSELERALIEGSRELARAKAELAGLRIQYRREVGTLHEELDELERQIAEAELGEMATRLEHKGRPQAQPEGPWRTTTRSSQ